jgi:hypothetical protein
VIEVKKVIEDANKIYSAVRGYPMQSYQIEALATALVNHINTELKELKSQTKTCERKCDGCRN